MSRFVLAIKAFWGVLTDAERAQAWQDCMQRLAAPPAAAATPAAAPPVSTTAAETAGAVYSLTLLQRHGRLIDFLQEDIDVYDDAQIGAAVRQIHRGCRKVLAEHFDVQAVRSESEGSKLTIESGFDPSAIRLTGSISGEPPFAGILQHKGWRAAKVQLPERHAKLDASIIQPAEVEV